MKTERTTYAINGIGPAGKGARELATERAIKRARARQAELIAAEENVHGMYAALKDAASARNFRGRPMQAPPIYARAASEVRMFASAAREIARLRKAGK